MPGEDVVRFIPRLRFSSRRKEQLKAENNEQEGECGDFVRRSAVAVPHADEYNGSSIVMEVQLKAKELFPSPRVERDDFCAT